MAHFLALAHVCKVVFIFGLVLVLIHRLLLLRREMVIDVQLGCACRVGELFVLIVELVVVDLVINCRLGNQAPLRLLGDDRLRLAIVRVCRYLPIV